MNQEFNTTTQALLWNQIWKIKVKILLWRICANKLQTMENLKQRIVVADEWWYLCFAPTESCSHLFFYCPVARAICLESSLRIRIDNLTITNHEDIVRLVLSPPIQLIGHSQWSKEDSQQCIFLMTLILKAIWNLMNFVAYQKGKVNIPIIIDHKAREYILAIG